VRLGVESILLLALGIVVYSWLSVYQPMLANAATFYLLLGVSCTIVITLLEQKFPIDKPNRWIVEAASYSFMGMTLIAAIFSFLHYSFHPAYVIMAEINALYFLLVALGEDLFTYGLPLTLEKHTPLGKGIYLVFLAMFAALHYPTYKNLYMLLQPFLAACINMYLVLKYRNVAGIILGHFLTDVVLSGVV
jgi:hypothetical protein